MARKCDASEPTTIYPTALADYSAGMHLVQGILLALLQRERTGRGQTISVSLYDSMLAMQMQEAAMWLMRSRDFSWGAMPYTGVFATTDGAIVIVGAFKANPLREISLALGLDDLSADARFADLEASRRNRTALHQILRARIASADTAHWIVRLEERDLLCAPVRSLGEALADPQTVANRMIVRSDGERPLGLVGSPVHLSDAEFALRHAPPALGKDGEAILAELGFGAAEIAAFKTGGVVG
jgi:formyl-CoA transferase